MQFTSKKFSTARYVIEPRDVVFTPGRPIQKVKGLAAVFHKFHFDSVETAKGMKWTDDQRMLVEATLLLDNDFGRRNSNTQGSIWLVPKGATVDVNVDIYDELEEFSPGLRQEVAERLGLEGNIVPVRPEETNCAQKITSDGDVRQCRRTAEVGRYCKQHARMQDADVGSDEIKNIIDAELTSA